MERPPPADGGLSVCAFRPGDAYYARVTEIDIAAALLAGLRTLLGKPDLSFAEAPERLTSSYDTGVYAFLLNGAQGDFAGPLVVRIFEPGAGRRAAAEGALHSAVAAQGYLVPKALHVSTTGGAIGRPYIIMPRAPGGTLMTAGLWRMPPILAAAHAALHSLDAAPIKSALGEACAAALPSGLAAWLDALRADVEKPGTEPLRPAFAWLDTHRPPPAEEALCHLDFHPLNILYHEGGVSGVIDWANAAFGDPAADVAVTRVILTLAPLDALPFLSPFVQVFRRLLAWRYTRAYRRHRPLNGQALAYYEALRCFKAMSHLSERRLAERAGRPANAAGYAWSDPATVRRLSNRFRRITGIRLDPVPDASN